MSTSAQPMASTSSTPITASTGSSSADPSTSSAAGLSRLPVVSTSSGFNFPAIYSFPPFYTKQRNTATANAQLSQWTSLVLDYCRHHRLYRLDLGETTLGHELWRNASIQRQLDADFQTEILKQMTSAGLAMWDPPMSSKALSVSRPTGAFIFYRKPEEWGEVIYVWVAENGLIGSILTLYELTSGGDLAPSTEFYELPMPILRLALQHLSKTGRASVFKGAGEDGDGVKFF